MLRDIGNNGNLFLFLILTWSYNWRTVWYWRQSKTEIAVTLLKALCPGILDQNPGNYQFQRCVVQLFKKSGKREPYIKYDTIANYRQTQPREICFSNDRTNPISRWEESSILVLPASADLSGGPPWLEEQPQVITPHAFPRPASHAPCHKSCLDFPQNTFIFSCGRYLLSFKQRTVSGQRLLADEQGL